MIRSGLIDVQYRTEGGLKLILSINNPPHIRLPDCVCVCDVTVIEGQQTDKHVRKVLLVGFVFSNEGFYFALWFTFQLPHRLQSR